jgi:NhaP-type Na+/H+ or K+/H+ antiporter
MRSLVSAVGQEVANATHNATHSVHGEGAHDTTHHTSVGVQVVFFLFVVLAAGAFVRHITTNFKAIPYTALLLIAGTGFGLLHNKNVFPGMGVSEATGFLKIVDMDPHLILYVFLPMLLFEATFALDTAIFKKQLKSILLLALPGVLMCSLLLGGLYLNTFPYEWTFAQSFLVGAIVSATDPVAVVALLKELGTSKDLAVLIEGESLVNDGTALVLFVVLQESVRSNAYSLDVGEAFVSFLYISGVGGIFGAVVGCIAVRWISAVFNDELVEITICISMAYIAYYVAEEIFHISGVLAVVTYGLYISEYGRRFISPSVEHFLHEFLDMTAFLMNTIIFVLAGTVIGFKLNASAADVLYIFINYLYCHVARALVVMVLFPLMKHSWWGKNENDGESGPQHSIQWQEAVVVIWGGLRGSVGLALALNVYQIADSTDDNKEFGKEVLHHVAGMVLLTVLINGTLMPTVIGFLDAGKRDVQEQR